MTATVADYSSIRPYEPPTDDSLPEAVIVDLDGTLALRRAFGRGPYEWSRVGEDLVNVPVMRVLHGLVIPTRRPRVIFVSGRDEVCRPETEAWLDEHYSFRYEGLHMRPAGDNRKDWIIKAELFDAHVRDRYRVALVLDDRNQVVRMWRHMGLTVLQVADNDF